jgi:hypothetical protein
VRCRSIQDRSAPLTNVWLAGGPGWSPFRMYQPCYSQVLITHGALEFVVVSRLFLGISISPTVGDSLPMQGFQYPRTTKFVCYGMNPSTSSMRLRATSSSAPHFNMFCTGGT